MLLVPGAPELTHAARAKLSSLKAERLALVAGERGPERFAFTLLRLKEKSWEEFDHVTRPNQDDRKRAFVQATLTLMERYGLSRELQPPSKSRVAQIERLEGSQIFDRR